MIRIDLLHTLQNKSQSICFIEKATVMLPSALLFVHLKHRILATAENTTSNTEDSTTANTIVLEFISASGRNTKIRSYK